MIIKRNELSKPLQWQVALFLNILLWCTLKICDYAYNFRTLENLKKEFFGKVFVKIQFEINARTPTQ